MNNFRKQTASLLISSILLIISATSCSEDEGGLAPYVGPPPMSTITVEEESFNPKITWVGGYTTILGVNRGNSAILDTSLVWLIKADDNSLKYPVQFNQLPGNATDITSDFGGIAIDSLNEDEDYTFWVMQKKAWDQVSNQTGKPFVVDTSLGTDQVVNEADTLKFSNSFYANFSKRLDVYINIEGVSTFGQLGIISINETMGNRPVIDWEITQEGVEDSLISVIGIAEGNQYDPGKTVWEVYSETIEGGATVYGTINVIASPLNVGDSLAQTRAFVPFDMEGLERGKTYYIWIANNLWDGEGRLRFAQGYAYATFNTR